MFTIESKKNKNESVKENFLNWLYENVDSYSQKFLDTIDFNAQNSDGSLRGVVTKGYISKSSTPFIIIPKKMLITDKMGKEIPWGKKLSGQRSGYITNKAFLTLYVLFTLDDDSHFFRPYYDFFPVDIGNIPLWEPVWDGELMNELKGTELHRLIKNKTDSLKKEYETIKKCLGSEFYNKYNYYDYLYIRLLVGSRNFFVTIDGVGTSVLTPFADMLNHTLPKQTRWTYNDEANGFIINAEVGINGGSELYDSYGLKENNIYMLHYGFIMEDNKEVLKMAKVKLPIKYKIVDLYSNMGVHDYTSLLEICRRLVAIESEKYNTLTNFLNKDNETRAHELLIKSCREKLEKYKYSLEDVVERFKHEKKYTNKRNIYFILKSELEIIYEIIEVSECALDKLVRGKKIPFKYHVCNEKYYFYLRSLTDT